jgi:acyl carrier protein
VVTVRQLIADVLGSPDIGPDDDFFDLGGDSLSAISLMTSISVRLGVELSVGVLFERPTARLLAEAVTRSTA